MRILNWNIPQFILDKLPSNKQKSIQIAWISSLLQPIANIYNGFKTFYLNTAEKLKYNGQVIILEQLLNDTFDNTARRIFIQNANETDFIDTIYFASEGAPETDIFYESEGEPPIYAYYETEAKGSVEFYVFVPIGLVYDAATMNSLINRYKLVTKRHTIIAI